MNFLIPNTFFHSIYSDINNNKKKNEYKENIKKNILMTRNNAIKNFTFFFKYYFDRYELFFEREIEKKEDGDSHRMNPSRENTPPRIVARRRKLGKYLKRPCKRASSCTTFTSQVKHIGDTRSRYRCTVLPVRYVIPH